MKYQLVNMDHNIAWIEFQEYVKICVKLLWCFHVEVFNTQSLNMVYFAWR